MKTATIQVAPIAHKALVAACKSMPAQPPIGKVASALVLWFSKQPDAAKTALSSGIDAGLEGCYADVLRRLADELEGKSRKGKR